MHTVVTDSAFVLIFGTFLILGAIIFARLCLKAPEAPGYMDGREDCPRKLARVRYRHGVPFIGLDD